MDRESGSSMKELISVRSLGQADLESMVSRALEYRELIDDRVPVTEVLSGLCVANLFFEPSTRTRLSFDLAAQKLGADVITCDPATSSTLKGESLRDTVLAIAAVGAHIMVVRHGGEGIPGQIAEWTGLPVINAGDGMNEHPTQALVDVVTIYRHFGGLRDLRMGIVGDIAHSRVAGSLIHVLPTLGVELTLIAPEEWLPSDSTLPATSDLTSIQADLDIVYLLRVQTERGATISDEYRTRFQLDSPRAACLRDAAVVMHPGPVNRGVEISDDVAESARSLITEQVANGVPTRMAVFHSIAGGLR